MATTLERVVICVRIHTLVMLTLHCYALAANLWWPEMAKSLEKLAQDMLPDLLDSSKPSWMAAIKLKKYVCTATGDIQPLQRFLAFAWGCSLGSGTCCRCSLPAQDVQRPRLSPHDLHPRCFLVLCMHLTCMSPVYGNPPPSLGSLHLQIFSYYLASVPSVRQVKLGMFNPCGWPWSPGCSCARLIISTPQLWPWFLLHLVHL